MRRYVLGKRRFVAYFLWQGFRSINLGVSLCLEKPNLEIHIPFGFFRIGWDAVVNYRFWSDVTEDVESRTYGYSPRLT
jgi:hypothetical protein